MALLDRLLFWTAQRRGYEIVEPTPDKDPVPPPSSLMTPELITARRLQQRRLEHVEAMAESFGLRMPPRGEEAHVDF